MATGKSLTASPRSEDAATKLDLPMKRHEAQAGYAPKTPVGVAGDPRTPSRRQGRIGASVGPTPGPSPSANPVGGLESAVNTHLASSGEAPDVSIPFVSRHAISALLGTLAFLWMIGALVWLLGASNPFTPAGYVGYLTKRAIFGQSRFYGVQRGPTSPGRTWLLRVTNVSVTPYTYHEDFVADEAVLSRDNLKIGFRVHTIWRIDDQQVPLFMDRFSTTVSDDAIETDPDAIVKTAYANYVREPLRTFAR